MQTQDTQTETGIPGLVNIPILGKYLFGANTKDKQKEELMIALIPHILRTPDISGIDLRGIAAGTDQTVKLSYGPRPEEQAAPGTPAPAGPAGAKSATPAPGTPITTPAAASGPGAAATTPVAPATPGGPPRISFAPGRLTAQLSSSVVVTLQADNMTNLAAVPVKIKWDPKILRLEKITPGGLLTNDGNVTAPSLDIRNDSGDASVDINRVAGSGGVNGSGPLMQFTFTAVGKGLTTVAVSEANLKDSNQQAISVPAPTLVVAVQ